MKIIKILLFLCIVSSVFTQLTSSASQTSQTGSGNSDSAQGPPIGQQGQQNTAGSQQPGNPQQGGMPQAGMPQSGQQGGPQTGGKAKKCSPTQAQQGQTGQGQGQGQMGINQGQMGQGQGNQGQMGQGQMGSNQGQGQMGQGQGQMGPNQGQGQMGPNQGQMGQGQGQMGQMGQGQGQMGQMGQGQMSPNQGQMGQGQGQMGQMGQGQGQMGQMGQGQMSPNQGQMGQGQGQMGQMGQGQGQMGPNQGQMGQGQGQGQGQKPQGPPQSNGQWTHDTERSEQCVEVEVTCADNELVFKDRCVAQTCENLDKVQAKQDGGKKKLPMRFDGKADFNDNKDVVVQLVFPDNKDKPLVKQDGNDNACIERSIYRYRPSFLSETLEDSIVTNNYDDDKQLRVWEFTILNADIDSKLFKDEQTDKVVYTGYYSVKLTIQEKKLVQFFFTFFVAVDLDGKVLTAQATSEAQDDTPACATEDNCVSRAETEVGFCSDQTCQSLVEQPQVYAGQNFYVVQRVKQTGFEQWKVGDADVTITGDGVNKKLKPTQQQQQPGQTIYTLNVNIIANNVEFSVNGKLEDPNAARRFRFLEASTDGTEVSSAKAVGSTTLECIKKDANSSCPSAEEAKAYNQPDCGTIGQMECETSNGYIWQFVIFAIIMLIQ